MDGGSSNNDALRVNADTPDKSVIRVESTLDLDLMKARVTTPGDNELGSGGDIKSWTDVPRDAAGGGSFATGTTWQLDDTKDDIKDISGED